MNTVFKLAWRNLFRNRRRTMISISSVMFGAFFCILMVSFMEGSMSYMVDSVVEREVGHFQVMDSGYWEDRTVETFIEVDENQLQEFAKNPLVKFVMPRAQTFAMAWNGTKTRPVSFNGIDPKREIQISKLHSRVLEGKFLEENDNGIIVGSKLAQSMGLKVGDTLTLIGQGYQGTNAAGNFPVRGIFKAYDGLTDARLIYTSLPALQTYIDMPNGVSGVAIVLHDKEKMGEAISQFKAMPESSNYNFVEWKELLKESTAGMASDKEAMGIFFYVLYIIVGFGLLSTVIMMTNERQKEFGVMAALGTKRSTMIWSIFFEMLFIGLIGVLLSSLLALPIVAWFYLHPLAIPVKQFDIMIQEFGLENYLPFALSAKIFLNQMYIVIGIAIFCTIYPWRKIRKMKIIEGLRG